MNTVHVTKDPFSPVLLSSPSLNVSGEQMSLIDSVLEKACSDSRFAQKASVAIRLILTAGNTVVPSVSSINPTSAKVGDPPVNLHVHGTHFTPTTQVIVGGTVRTTTFVSETELTTSLDIPANPGLVPVAAQADNGYLTPSKEFTVNPTTPLVHSSTKSDMEVDEPKEKELHKGKK